jgi:hypothetical protein
MVTPCRLFLYWLWSHITYRKCPTPIVILVQVEFIIPGGTCICHVFPGFTQLLDQEKLILNEPTIWLIDWLIDCIWTFKTYLLKYEIACRFGISIFSRIRPVSGWGILLMGWETYPTRPLYLATPSGHFVRIMISHILQWIGQKYLWCLQNTLLWTHL